MHLPRHHFHKKKKLSTLKASNIALAQISHEAPLLQGIRLPNYFQIRLFNDEQIEGILSELLILPEQFVEVIPVPLGVVGFEELGFN